VFDETHERTVFPVDIKGRGCGGIHSDPADLADVGQRENVGDGVGIVPHFTKIGEISDHIGVLVSAVGDGPEDMGTVADVA